MKRFDILESNGKIVEIIRPIEGKGCTEPLVAKTADSSTEKHVPFIKELEDGYLVKIGENAAHPMIEEHFIEFVELIIDDSRVYRHHLKPGDASETFFKVEKGSKVRVLEYCNLHGLWENNL